MSIVSRPLNKAGCDTHERIFGPHKKFTGVVRTGPEVPREKVMDKQWSREFHNANNTRKLEKDEQKFEVPSGNHEVIYMKKSWSDKEKRRVIAEACNRAGYRPGDKDVTPDSIELVNG